MTDKGRERGRKGRQRKRVESAGGGVRGGIETLEGGSQCIGTAWMTSGLIRERKVEGRIA